MRKRLIPLIAIAFVVAVASTALLYTLLAGRLDALPSASKTAGAAIVVASRDVAAGTVLSAADLGSTHWPTDTSPIPKGSFVQADQVRGKTTLSALEKGEPIVVSHLAAPDGAGSGIPQGMRAVSIHVSDSAGVVTLIKPGSKVDVQQFSDRTAKVPREDIRTLLRGVTVLALGPPEQSSQGHFTAPVATLLVEAKDAEALAFADSYARLRLALRNPLEKGAVQPPPQVPASAQPAQAAQPATRGAAYRVQAIELTDEGLTDFAARIDRKLTHESPAVIQTADGATGAFKTGPAPIRQARVETASNQWASFDVARGSARIRLLLASAVASSTVLRVRQEVTGAWAGRVETRSIETLVDTARGKMILVTGLDTGDDAHRHVLIVITPETTGNSPG